MSKAKYITYSNTVGETLYKNMKKNNVVKIKYINAVLSPVK